MILIFDWSFMQKIFDFIKATYFGIGFIAIIAILSFIIANTSYIKNMHISVLIIGICLGAICSFIFLRHKQHLESGINFSAKNLLRIGIVLFGFNISLSGIASLGFKGFFIALIIVSVIFSSGYFIGTRILKLDKQISMLISIGSAVCGAAAILALESVIKSQSYKNVAALASIVIFGLLGMFLFPTLINSGIIPLDDMEKGLFLGAALHEVANVVGAAGAIISPNNQAILESAIILKMIRVILLVPLLLIISFLISKDNKTGKIYIPWFAIFFLFAIIINSIIEIPIHILQIIKTTSNMFLVFAMIALGLQIDFKKIKQIGLKIFILSIVLFIFLAILSFILVVRL